MSRGKRVYVAVAVVVTVVFAIYNFNARSAEGSSRAAAAIDSAFAVLFYALVFAGLYRLGVWIGRRRRRI